MKLHLCCGDVYLEGYFNVDITGLLSYTVTDNPNVTTLSQYYKYNFKQDTPRVFIIDKQMNILDRWDFEDKSIEEVVMISAIEHFPKLEAEYIVSEVKRVLQPGGKFIFDFPDILGDVKWYAESNPEFLMELIYCNHKNKYSIHHWGYTVKTANTLLGDGWVSITEKTIVVHDYPMTGIVAVKE